MSGTVLVFVRSRETKRFALYIQEGNDMNKLYLDKSLPEKVTIIVEPKAA